MVPKIIFLAIIGFVACNPVTTKIEHLVKQTYNRVMNAEVGDGVDKIKDTQLPVEIQEFIKHVTEDQLPLITGQIKEEAKKHREHIKDLEHIIEEKAKTYIKPMKIRDMVSDHITRRRRDDDEMPNYLDHLFGGLGR